MSTPRPWLAHYPHDIVAEPTIPEKPLYRLLADGAASYPDLPAVRFVGHQLTYSQLWNQAQKAAAAFAEAGVQPGDRIALMLPNCPQYVVAYFGALRAGAIVVQVNPLYTSRELQYILSNAGAEYIVVADALYSVVQATLSGTTNLRVFVARLRGDAALGPEARGFEDALATAQGSPPDLVVDPHSVAVLQYTGGTTGVSKGAMLTHLNLVANVTQIQAFNPHAPPAGEGRVLTVLPLFHVYAMTVCMNYGLSQGWELILLPRFELSDVMESIRTTHPTHFPGVPTMYVAVNNYPNAEAFGLDSIRYCNSGAAPMPVEVMQTFERRFGTLILEGYGLSEASPVTHGHAVGGVRKPGTVGMPIPATDAEIVDVLDGTTVLPAGEAGEIRIRGPQVMAGYWEKPEETSVALRDGWLYTGDIGRMDEDGYFTIVDRKNDMIIASGYNVYPRDVEEVLYEHPAIQECCVAGVPSAYRGETVKAYVVLKPNATLTAEDLTAYCQKNLAAFKVPKIIEFRDSLPKSAVGKILRRTLVAEEKQGGSE
jgi:long-chain acyl-CoA synthetase